MDAIKFGIIRTIAGIATLGGFYKLFATTRVEAPAHSLFEMTVSFASGVILSGVASILICRLFYTWQFIHEFQDQHDDGIMCYRGVRYLSSPASSMKFGSHENDDSLCYRGAHSSSTEVDLKSVNDNQDRQIDAGLCYRGVHVRHALAQ